jgi:hypothetical protein
MHSKGMHNWVTFVIFSGLADCISSGVSQVQSRCKASRGNPNLVIFSGSSGGRGVVESLCPPLYSLLSDGLCPWLETIFGRIPNTVWRVVEASIQCGEVTLSLMTFSD